MKALRHFEYQTFVQPGEKYAVGDPVESPVGGVRFLGVGFIDRIHSAGDNLLIISVAHEYDPSTISKPTPRGKTNP